MKWLCYVFSSLSILGTLTVIIWNLFDRDPNWIMQDIIALGLLGFNIFILSESIDLSKRE